MIRAPIDWIRGPGDARILEDEAARADRPRLRTVLVAAAVPVVVLLIGVAIRISMHPARDVDEREFMDVGRHIVDTGLPIQTTFPPASFFFDHTPLYPYFVALLQALLGAGTVILRASSLGFSMLTVALVFLIGLRVRGLGAALVGSVLVTRTPFGSRIRGSSGWKCRSRCSSCSRRGSSSASATCSPGWRSWWR